MILTFSLCGRSADNRNGNGQYLFADSVGLHPYVIGMAIIFTVTFLITGILVLIKDMDNPFETGGAGSADVDLSHIYKLDKYLKSHDEVQ